MQTLTLTKLKQTLSQCLFQLGLTGFVIILSACGDSGSKVTQESDIEMETFSGSIENGLNYSIKVNYIATNDSSKCRNWQLFAGSNRGVIERYYLPTINNGEHSIIFPRNQISSRSYCQWEPVSADICVGQFTDPTDNSCSTFLDLTHYYGKYGAANHDELIIPELPIEVLCGSHNRSRGNIWTCESAFVRADEIDKSQLNPRFPLKLIRQPEKKYRLNIRALSQ